MKPGLTSRRPVVAPAWLVKAATQGAACGIVLGLTLLVGTRSLRAPAAVAQERPDPSRITTREVVVTDESGKKCAELGLYGLLFFGDKDRDKATVYVSSHGLAIYDGRLTLMVDRSGFMISGPDGSTAGVGQDSLTLSVKGQPRLLLSTWANFPHLAMFDTHGNKRIDVSVSPYNGGARIAIDDSSGSRRAVLGAATLREDDPRTGAELSLAESSLVLFDNRGRLIWRAP